VRFKKEDISMRKEFGLVLLALLFLSINAITGAYAVEDIGDEKESQVQNQEKQTLIKEEADVSGDGKPDAIKITGIHYEEGSSYLKEIYLEIKGSNGNHYRTELDSGYEPTLELVDLNHDGKRKSKAQQWYMNIMCHCLLFSLL